MHENMLICLTYNFSIQANIMLPELPIGLFVHQSTSTCVIAPLEHGIGPRVSC